MCTISTRKPATTFQRLVSYSHKFLLILINPLALLFVCELIRSVYTQSDQSLFVHLNNSFIAQKYNLLSLVEDWYLFGNWTYLIGSVALFPMWIQFWYILN